MGFKVAKKAFKHAGYTKGKGTVSAPRYTIAYAAGWDWYVKKNNVQVAMGFDSKSEAQAWIDKQKKIKKLMGQWI